MPRQVVPLLYGAGLDRATGLLSTEGRAGRDLRNVYLYRDKAQVRRGHQRVNLLTDEGGHALDDVLLVQALQAEQAGLVAGYGSDGRVHLFRVAGDGSGLSRIGVAFTVTAGAHSPPRLLAAEQYAKAFVAHDEAVRTLRAPTVIYDPFGVPALATLMADLDGDGTSGPVQFRGVAPYLTYVVGWGFGTETDPDHPETVRISDPENPASFAPDDYALAGTGGSPVLNCLPAGTPDGSSLLVFKPTELHQIFGYDKRTFGVRQIDNHGLAGSRLAYSLGGVVYFWSEEGPRRSSGGPSEDLAWPLDLDAPSPADLVAAGAVEDGFACYLPHRRAILFVFGARMYVLNLWDAGALKWSYGELGFAAQCGGLLFGGAASPETPPTGAASNVLLVATGDTTLHATWTNNGLTGGEVAEVWTHALTVDRWILAGQAPASGATQALDLTDVVPGTDHQVQVRYRRGPYYRADYVSSDPAAWPSGSLSGTATTTIAAPVLWLCVWGVVGVTAFVAWHGSLVVESLVYRDGTPIATVPPGGDGYMDSSPGAHPSYTVTQRGDIESAMSNTGGPL